MSFTIEQISATHSKVKSGADFPKYIQNLKKLGVISYDCFVNDGHADYYGSNHFKASSVAKYPSLSISENVNVPLFTSDLKAHQRGETDYFTFCKDCAKSGIYKWIVDLEKMTCTYYDIQNNELLIEQVPSL